MSEEFTNSAKMKKLNKVQPQKDGSNLRVVTIAGMAPSADVTVPYGEVWCINHSWCYGNWPNKLFIMDGLKAMYEEAQKEGFAAADFCNFVKDHPEMDLISAFAEPVILDGVKIRDCTPYPIAEALKLIPGTFVNNSVSYALAYAAVQEALGQKKIDVINLIGVELWMSFDQAEYEFQRPNVDFWIPFLYGKGIQVNVPAYLLYAKDTKKNLYGYIRR
jgi:hypothetical protein